VHIILIHLTRWTPIKRRKAKRKSRTAKVEAVPGIITWDSEDTGECK